MYFSTAVTSATEGTNYYPVNIDSSGLGYVALPAFKTSDNNTTYTFANGTNGFTVTPSGGTAQTVTVTPSITNNVTGSGTSGYLAKFNGANTITNAVALGSDTTKYLRNDGMHVEEGVFQTHMMVDLTNDGPVTILLDSKKTF